MLAASQNAFLQQTSQPVRYPNAYPASTPSPSDRDGRFKQQRQDFPWDGQQQQHVLAYPPSSDSFQPQLNNFMQPSNPQLRLSQHPQMPHTPPTSIASSSPSRRPAGAFPDNTGRWPGQQLKNMLRNPAPLQHQRGPSNSSNESRMSASSFSQPGMMAGSYPTPAYDTTTFNMVSGPDSAAAVAAFNPYSRNDLAVPSQDDMPQLSPSHVHLKNRPSVSSDFQGPLTPRTHVTDDMDHTLDASNFDYKPKMGASTLETLDEMYRTYPQQQHHQHSNSLNRSFHRPGQRMQNGMPSPNASLDTYLRAANNEHLHPHGQQQQQVFGGHSPFNQDVATPKTISPKDTLLEATEQDEEQAQLMPLFPVSSQSPIQRTSDLGYNMDSRRTSSAFSLGSTFNTIPAPTSLLTQYPFVPRHERMQPEPPEFKVSLLRMGTQGSDYSDPSRPANTRAETGTYTCTYHGCTLRFESPQKLQKHKREGHRQNHAHAGDITPGGGVRDSQAGPHTCRRINPSTGKPCNTQFSRPYDLTRHEDTIHNARKQKVRCELCTEEKTFSRNDALTRHMRVVHPEVDFPGKSRRKAMH